MARTRLRIIIPLLQVLILILTFSLDPLLSKRYVTRSDLAVAYIVTPERLVLKLNFPLAILGMPIVYLTARAFPNTGSPTGALHALIFGAYVLAILTSAAMFWYLVVVEVEMRKRNSSCLRFSGRHLEKLKAVVLILMGAGTVVFALWDSHGLIVRSRINSLYWSSLADTLIGGLFLLGWAAALITIGVQDIVRVQAQDEPVPLVGTPRSSNRSEG
jgi:hypothetical protein